MAFLVFALVRGRHSELLMAAWDSLIPRPSTFRKPDKRVRSGRDPDLFLRWREICDCMIALAGRTLTHLRISEIQDLRLIG